MKIIDILKSNIGHDVNKIIYGSRGIVIKDNKILIIYEKKTDMYLIPGGGLEKDETLSQCVIRELREETGYIVNADNSFLCLGERRDNIKYLLHYFLCTYIDECEMSLTEKEIELGIEPIWMGIDEFFDIVSKYEKYKEKDLRKSNSYYWDYLAIKEMCY